MAEHPVPTIDIAPFVEGGEAGRDAVARAVGRACEETGFFAITGHGVAEQAIEELRAEAVGFFALPDERKRRVERPADRISRGWNALCDRSLAYSLGQETPPDLQESFAIGPVAVPEAPYFTCERARAFFAPNIWPGERPGLRRSMERYYRSMEALSQTVMRIFARALGRDDFYFDDRIDRHSSSLRLIRYPGRVAGAAAGQRRAGEHHDYGSLTILRGDNVPGGLQVKLRHGGWIDVVRPDGGFICNIGDAMMRWTNDRWVSTLHRVGLPDGPDSPDRISIVFFHNPNYDAEIRCIAGDGEAARYPPAVFDSFYLDKLRRGSFGAAVAAGLATRAD
ncbi:MAG: isopenicillin N synthase family oxygenase [Defluviicoccus sp.]|nr:isopenicillin N synthase family oxygenase [Defluviicoccus sp.]